MYDKFRDGENLYFDLDVIIYDKLPNLIRKEFTLLDDSWWREPAHTPLNSSIVSWTGDKSWIWDKFKSNDTEYLKVYNKLNGKLADDQVLQLHIKGGGRRNGSYQQHLRLYR